VALPLHAIQSIIIIMMLPSISILSLAAALFLGAAQAAESKKAPHPHNGKHCADPPVRKEW